MDLSECPSLAKRPRLDNDIPADENQEKNDGEKEETINQRRKEQTKGEEDHLREGNDLQTVEVDEENNGRNEETKAKIDDYHEGKEEKKEENETKKGQEGNVGSKENIETNGLSEKNESNEGKEGEKEENEADKEGMKEGYRFGQFRLDDSDDEELGATASASRYGLRTQVRGLPDNDLIIDTDEYITDRYGERVAENWARENHKLSKSQLLQLQDKAERHFERFTSFVKADYFYRDKPKAFFDAAELKNGIMAAYRKDNTGDQKSPINANIDGLFFATSQPPTSMSRFGDTRIKVPAKLFLSRQAQKSNTSKRVRLYFTDFYCMDRRSLRHWVTIVLTYEGSIADQFCQHKLPRLILNDNKFLKVSGDSVSVRSSECNRVEIYYAADFDINYWKDNGAVVGPVDPEGRGRSTPGGKRKRPFCSTCNL